ncbi:hypothetical protein ACHAWF_010775 [Thalassiosira exigua]
MNYWSARVGWDRFRPAADARSPMWTSRQEKPTEEPSRDVSFSSLRVDAQAVGDLPVQDDADPLRLPRDIPVRGGIRRHPRDILLGQRPPGRGDEHSTTSVHGRGGDLGPGRRSGRMAGEATGGRAYGSAPVRRRRGVGGAPAHGAGSGEAGPDLGEAIGVGRRVRQAGGVRECGERVDVRGGKRRVDPLRCPTRLPVVPRIEAAARRRRRRSRRGDLRGRRDRSLGRSGADCRVARRGRRGSSTVVRCRDCVVLGTATQRGDHLRLFALACARCD